MRPKARAFLLTIITMSALALPACNSGLPVAPSPTPSALPALEATAVVTATSGSSSQRPKKATKTPDTNNALPTPEPTSQPTLPVATAESTVEPTVGAAGSPTEEATVSVGADAALSIEVKQIEQDAAKVRGLTPTGSVPETFLNDAQMHDNLLKDISENYTHPEAQDDASELWLMRLVNAPSIDLYQLQVDLQNEQVLGYYDPKKKDLFVLRNGTDLGPTARVTLAHEYTHALQDQHFDLQKMLPDKTNDDDKALAIRSLVEGDATMSGFTYAKTYFTPAEVQQFINDSSNAPTNVLDKAPVYIKESLYFPYNDGPNFVNQLLSIDGFRAVDKALADPPTSSEQIMHPDKYLNTPRDEPISVPLPPLTSTLGTGWTMKDFGTLGEFDFKTILQENNAPNPDTAAAGWGGASYGFYRQGATNNSTNTDPAVMYIKSVWDTQKDADEFNTALIATFSKNSKSGTLYTDGTRFFSLQASGKEVTLVSSNSQDALLKVVGSK